MKISVKKEIELTEDELCDLASKQSYENLFGDGFVEDSALYEIIRSLTTEHEVSMDDMMFFIIGAIQNSLVIKKIKQHKGKIDDKYIGEVVFSEINQKFSSALKKREQYCNE